MLPVVVARSSSDDNAVRYVLPVLWMTSCFHVIGQIHRGHWRIVHRDAASGAVGEVCYSQIVLFILSIEISGLMHTLQYSIRSHLS